MYLADHSILEGWHLYWYDKGSMVAGDLPRRVEYGRRIKQRAAAADANTR